MAQRLFSNTVEIMSLSDAFVGLVKAVASRGRIERLCSELGWSIDEQKGDNFGLAFSGSGGKRMVYIGKGSSALPLFVVNSHASFSMKNVPDEPVYFALSGNSKSTFGKWEPREDDDEMRFILAYTALGDGLTPELFKEICLDMVRHANIFDQHMQERGLL